MAHIALFGHASLAGAAFAVYAVTAPGAKRWFAFPAATPFTLNEPDEMRNQALVITEA